MAAIAITLFVTGSVGALEIPEPLKAGHQELYTQLEEATQAGGKTGEAARKAMSALRGHFEKEERYALPQLGALAILTRMPGHEQAKLTQDQRQELIARTEQFRSELPQMLREHEKISEALKELRQVADREDRLEIARLAKEIMTHAETEELVLYPAALLIGEYLKAADQANR